MADSLTRRKFGASLAAWWAFWFLPGAAASVVLLTEVNSPAVGAVLHCVLLLALWCAALLPFSADILRGQLSRLQLIILAILLASLQFCLWTFYALSAIGHRFWGDWINTTLVAAYGPHFLRLLDALEMSSAATLAAICMVWLLIFVIHLALLRVIFTCRAKISSKVSTGVGLTIITCMVATLMIFYWSYVVDFRYWGHEPLRQSSLRSGFGAAGQGQFFDPDRLRLDRDAIAAYQPSAPSARPRPLVLILVDALRSDQMGVYGGPVDNTPFLSNLAKKGELLPIENAYSVCTTSYCGILGTLASRHWFQMTPQPWNIADVLRRFGYESRFILSGDHTSYFGLRTMYGPSVSVMLDSSDQTAFYNNDDELVLAALDKVGWPANHPGFMYIHLMSVHRLGLIQKRNKRWNDANAPAWSAYEAVDVHKNSDMRARYHNGIAQADEVIGEIFKRLERMHVLDDAVVIIAADHGELLGELDLTSHGHVPYEPVVRIPLLIYDRQGLAGYLPRGLVSQVDIAPTLLRAIGAQQPANWSGVALQESFEREAIVIESAEASGVVAILGKFRYKYLRLRKSGMEMLFEIRATGGAESINLADKPERAPLLGQLRALHEKMTKTSTPRDIGG